MQEPPETTRASYFTVGAVKFCLLSLITGGVYDAYWFYRNWRVIRQRGAARISPFWRASLAPLWVFSMGRHFKEEAAARHIDLTLPVPILGTLYLLASVGWKLPDPYWLLSAAAFIFILPFDFAARRIDGDGVLAPPTHGNYSAGDIVWLVAGSLFWVLALISWFWLLPLLNAP